MGRQNIRINFSDEGAELFRQFETVCVLLGKDSAAEVERFASEETEKSGKISSLRDIVDSEGLGRLCEERFGTTLKREELFKLRETFLAEGVDFWSAPAGRTRSFRYHAEKCLPKVGLVLKLRRK